MKFVSRITTRDVTNLTLEQYLQMKASVPGDQFTMCEYLQGDDLYTKPYYDFEQYFDKEPTASVKEQAFDSIKYSLCDTFQADKTFDLAKSVAIATRHGVVGGKFKLSFRVFVVGYAIKYVQMPALIKTFCPGVNFDLSPYKAAEQLLAVVGGCKGKVGSRPDDRRVLTTLTHQDEPWAFLAQLLRGDESVLEVPTHETDGNGSGSSSGTNRGRTAEQLGVADIDPRIMPAVEAALAAMEPSDTTSCFHRFTRFQDGTVSIYMKTVGERKCPYGSVHTSNNFYVHATRQGLLRYRCLGSLCREEAAKKIGTWFDSVANGDAFDARIVVTFDLKTEKQRILDYYNRFFALVHLNKPVVFEFQHDQLGRRVSFNERSIRSTQELMMDCKAHFKIWQEAAEKSRFRYVVYEPNDDVVKVDQLNTFIDIRAELENDMAMLEEADTELIQPILWHIEHILCNGNKEFFYYLIRWMALPLQPRGQKTEVLVCITGDQGTGKGLVFNHLLGQGVYGKQNYTHVEDADKLLGRFNSLTARKLFVYLDEVKSYGNTFKEADKMKALITETTSTVEVKGLDACTISNHTNYIMATNHDVPLRIESSDRRYAVIRASSEKCGDYTYFNKLAEMCSSAEVAKHFYKFLATMDLFDWTARAIPMTNEKRDMMDVVVEPEWRFMQDMIEEGMLDEEEARVIPTKMLFARYLDWCRQNNIPVVGKGQDGMLKVWKRVFAIGHKEARKPDEEGNAKRQRCTYLPTPDDIQRQMANHRKWIG